jgi:hypothetical protein
MGSTIAQTRTASTSHARRQPTTSMMAAQDGHQREERGPTAVVTPMASPRRRENQGATEVVATRLSPPWPKARIPVNPTTRLTRPTTPAIAVEDGAEDATDQPHRDPCTPVVDEPTDARHRHRSAEGADQVGGRDLRAGQVERPHHRVHEDADPGRLPGARHPERERGEGDDPPPGEPGAGARRHRGPSTRDLGNAA